MKIGFKIFIRVGFSPNHVIRDTFRPGYKVLPGKINRQWIGIGFLNKWKRK